MRGVICLVMVLAASPALAAGGVFARKPQVVVQPPPVIKTVIIDGRHTHVRKPRSIRRGHRCKKRRVYRSLSGSYYDSRRPRSIYIRY